MVEKVTTIHLDTIDSTNTYVKENYQQFGQDEITRITADEQLKGRGRFKRNWLSPKGMNIYLTYYFTSNKNPHNKKMCLKFPIFKYDNSMKKSRIF